MGTKVKQITLWTQASKLKRFDLLKSGLERRAYHQFQVDLCVFYIKDSVILTYVDDCVMISHKQETIALLIESPKNGPENYVLTDERDISNYLGVNIKENSDWTFKLSQSHLVEKIINHVGLEVSVSLKSIDTTAGKPLMHKERYSLGRKCVWNVRAVDGMLIYLQGSIQLEISIPLHQCARFFQ